ncbi:hypothetical protein ADEAN_000092500 [Angomonas deanei]|uniref:Uncharacterized protein n=1 Tax=Angomonas deanei TaxID=59799 RepID=A0A7G2C2L2_9TRYP|nr:hypothetical protein ADEAN_000092500 [Angomonas deanei]
MLFDVGAYFSSQRPPLSFLACSQTIRFQGERDGWHLGTYSTRLEKDTVMVRIEAVDPIAPLEVVSWWLKCVGRPLALTVCLASGQVDLSRVELPFTAVNVESEDVHEVILSSEQATCLSHLSFKGCKRLKEVKTAPRHIKLPNVYSVLLSDCPHLTDFSWLDAAAVREFANDSHYSTRQVAYPAFPHLHSLKIMVSSEKDLDPFVGSVSMEEIHVNSNEQCTLNHFPTFPKLRVLSLRHVSVSSLQLVLSSPLLKDINLTCGGLQTLSPVEELHHLTGLEFCSLGPSFDTAWFERSHFQSLSRLRMNLKACGEGVDLFKFPGPCALSELQINLSKQCHTPSQAWTCVTSLDLQSSFCTLDEMTPLGMLNGVQVLNLSGNKGSNIDWLKYLTNCTDLNLRLCKQVRDISAIGSLASLQHVNLSDMCLKNVAPLFHCSLLETLHMSSSDAGMDSEAIPPACVFTRLRVLDMQRSSGDAALPIITASPHLEVLQLRWFKSALRLSSVGSLDSLRCLYLNNTSNDFSACAWVPRCHFLEELDLGKCGVSKNFGSLKGLTHIREFRARGCSDLYDLDFLEGSARAISVLSLEGCCNLTNVSRLSSMFNMTSLELSGCPSEEMDRLYEGATRPKLQHLNVSGVPMSLTGDLSFFKYVREVNFSHVDVSDFSAIAQLRCVRRVNLSFTGIASLEWLDSALVWETLTVDHCNALRDISKVCVLPYLEEIRAVNSALESIAFVDECPSLRMLEVGGCKNLQKTKIKNQKCIIVGAYNVM